MLYRSAVRVLLASLAPRAAPPRGSGDETATSQARQHNLRVKTPKPQRIEFSFERRYRPPSLDWALCEDDDKGATGLRV